MQAVAVVASSLPLSTIFYLQQFSQARLGHQQARRIYQQQEQLHRITHILYCVLSRRFWPAQAKPSHLLALILPYWCRLFQCPLRTLLDREFVSTCKHQSHSKASLFPLSLQRLILALGLKASSKGGRWSGKCQELLKDLKNPCQWSCICLSREAWAESMIDRSPSKLLLLMDHW